MIRFLDCMPMMADVVSGAIPEPRERRKHEAPFQWLRQTPAMLRLEREFPEFVKRWPTIKYLRDLKPTQKTGLANWAHYFVLTWENPPNAHTLILAVNEDGTRCALADLLELLTEAWTALDRSGTGRPLTDTTNPKSLAQRKWREGKKKI